MNFVLKDGYIYLVKNSVPANNKIEAKVVTEYISDPNAKLSYSFNEGPFKPIKNKKIVIEKDEIKKPYLELRIKAGGQIFKTDKLPLTYSLIVGAPIEDCYEETMNVLFKRVSNVVSEFKRVETNLLNEIKKLEEKIKELEEVGDIV